MYKAHGSNASWEWLSEVAPTVEVLRRIATQINHDLGSCQGTKHSTPNLDNDIKELMQSLKDNSVYQIEEGRSLESTKSIVTDVLSEGVVALSEGPALKEYNDAFKILQERRRAIPLIGEPAVPRFPLQTSLSESETASHGAHPVEEDRSSDGSSTTEDNWSSPSEDDPYAMYDARDELLPLETESDVELDMD